MCLQEEEAKVNNEREKMKRREKSSPFCSMEGGGNLMLNKVLFLFIVLFIVLACWFVTYAADNNVTKFSKEISRFQSPH